MIRSQLGQRLVGAGLLLSFTLLTVDEWYDVLHGLGYRPKAAALFPCFALCGLGLLLSPMDYDQLMAEHGVEKPTTFRHMPPFWKVYGLLVVALSLANWYAMAHA